jgi:AcrR family transcriptional regulator/protein-L-isoaspartate O-methyltransferase
MNVNRRTQAERRAATRAALIAAARPLFAERGYADVGTEEIVQRAGVTRGALYHHFAGKQELFHAVCEEVEREVTERIAREVPLEGDPDPLGVLRRGAATFLDACLEPEVQRITLLEAPAVLGWEQWRAIGERYGLGLTQAALQGAVDAGAIRPQPVRPLAHVLLGALTEASLLIARAHDVDAARREVGATLDRLLESLRAADPIVAEFTGQSETFNASAVARAPESLDELIRVAAPQRDERWLDAACGPGVVSRALAPLAGAVHGVDLTPAMVELARREAAAAGLENATFAVGDATALAVGDGTFDGALARFVVHHMPLPGRLFAELARVVRPDGAVVLADHVADDDAQAAAWATEIERLRDPTHWAALPVGRLRALGAAAELELEHERLLPLRLDFEDWLRRGSGGQAARPLIERALEDPPPAAECFRVRDGVLELRLWLSRWRRARF